MQTMIDQNYRVIGDNIYRFRVLQHMTQEQLAESSHVTSPYISQIERANLHKGITCTAMVQIAKSLNVPVCILMAEEPCQKYLECLGRAAMHRPVQGKPEEVGAVPPVPEDTESDDAVPMREEVNDVNEGDAVPLT